MNWLLSQLSDSEGPKGPHPPWKLREVGASYAVYVSDAADGSTVAVATSAGLLLRPASTAAWSRGLLAGVEVIVIGSALRIVLALFVGLAATAVSAGRGTLPRSARSSADPPEVCAAATESSAAVPPAEGCSEVLVS